MLLLLNSWSLFSQSNTSQSGKVEIPVSQVAELYKIAKQNEFLKDLTIKQEKELDNAKKLIADQKRSLDKYAELSAKKDDLLKQEKFKSAKELEMKDVEIKRLNDIAEVNTKISKRNERKKFWKGFTVGGVTVGAIGTATVLYLISK